MNAMQAHFETTFTVGSHTVPALFKEDHAGVLMLSTDRGEQFLTCWNKCGRSDGAVRVQNGDVKGAALKWLADRCRILEDAGSE